VKLASWRDFPPFFKKHLDERLKDRTISGQDLVKLQFWVQTDPDVPEGDWFKDFGSFKLCGTGKLPKTFLAPGMAAFGQELDPKHHCRG
jgi:hypothetical protein